MMRRVCADFIELCALASVLGAVFCFFVVMQ
jgi:hypothetical protein